MSVNQSSGLGPFGTLISNTIQKELQPSVFELYNDSHKHAHHASMRGSSNIIESHFRLVVVSDKFQGMSQPARHRLIYALFKDEMAQANGIHAMQLLTKTPQEYEKIKQRETDS